MMGLLNDRQIRELCEWGDTISGCRKGDFVPMIVPFERRQIREVNEGPAYESSTGDGPDYVRKVISYGLSSFGYDIRLGHDYRIFRPRYDEQGVVDPKRPDELLLERYSGDSCVIPPNSYILARSLEAFAMPEDVIAICLGKSTYARCAIQINVTPLEPGWRGVLTIEISNACPQPVRLHSGEGICQLVFFRGERPETSYAQRQGGGKYQNQPGVTPAKL